MKVLVTGASGFVGRALAPKLADKGHVIVSVGRQEVGEFGPTTDWAPHLDGIDAVVHLAARVHVMVDNVADPIAEFQARKHARDRCFSKRGQVRRCKPFRESQFHKSQRRRKRSALFSS